MRVYPVSSTVPPAAASATASRPHSRPSLSTTPDSVAARKRWPKRPAEHYTDLCALYSICPKREIVDKLERDHVLDARVDRDPVDAWRPLLLMLNSTRALRGIRLQALNAATRRTLPAGPGPSIAAGTLAERPRLLYSALEQTLMHSSPVALTTLELTGIDLSSTGNAQYLAEGLSANQSLRVVSLAASRMGDASLMVLAGPLRSHAKLAFLDLSFCALTAESGSTLADLLSGVAARADSNDWEESLRNREPSRRSKRALCRLTLCGNMGLGDATVMSLAAVLCDDVWLRALDLQQCGVTSEGARALLDMLRLNERLTLVDLRGNRRVDGSVWREVKGALVKNVERANSGHDRGESGEEYARLPAEATVWTSAVDWLPVLPVVQSLAIGTEGEDVHTKAQKGKAKKKKKLKKKDKNKDKDQRRKNASSETVSDTSTEHQQRQHTDKTHHGHGHDHEEEEEEEKEEDAQTATESELRRIRAETRAVELEIENCRLQEKLRQLERTVGALRLPLRSAMEQRERAALLRDAQVLDSIESTFRQFNRFLDELNSVRAAQAAQ